MLLRKLVVGAFFLFGVFLLLQTPIETVQPTIVLETPSFQDSSDRDRKLKTLATQILSYGSYGVDERSAEFLSDLILKYSEEFIPDFDTALICGHFFAESSFQTNQVNPRDPSYGLGQIMLPTAKRIAKDLNVEFPRSRGAQIRFLLDPENNIRFSLFYLRNCRRQVEGRRLPRFATDMLAIAAYNGNPNFRSKHLLRVRRILKGEIQ